MMRNSSRFVLAALLTISPGSVALGGTLPLEVRLAIDHVKEVIPGTLARYDEELRLAIEQADRASRGVIVASQSEPTVANERSAVTYASPNAMMDMVMSCEYTVALWSRQIDLIERGLYFEVLPESVAQWKPGVVGVLSKTGTFDDRNDRTVTMKRIVGKNRMLVTATVHGVDAQPSDSFVLEGVATDGLNVGDRVPIQNDAFAVVSEEMNVSADLSERLPVLKPVDLVRFGPTIAENGRRAVTDFRRDHLRPTAEKTSE